jgi:hypothetical protein
VLIDNEIFADRGVIVSLGRWRDGASARLIKATCFYFSEQLRQEQWLPVIIAWEQQNHIAMEIGVKGEPGSSPHWPCDAAAAALGSAAARVTPETAMGSR